MNKHKYHRLDSLLDGDKKEKIKARVIGKNNIYTGEVMEFDLDQLISPDCSGSCGATRAVCILREKNCFNWQCLNLDCRNYLIIYRRPKKIQVRPVCQVCSSRLIRSKSQYD